MMFLALVLLAAEPRLALELGTTPANPRNTEGSFVRLKDGRWLYAYSKFTGGGSDHATAHIAARYSNDGGLTWTAEDQVLLENDGGLNVMSVSLLRLRSGEIALFTIRKNSMRDCKPVLRVSRDEGRTWSAPRETIAESGYYVLNNDRAVQLKSGRLLLPVALHENPNDDPKQFNGRGRAMVYLSDDRGQTWRRSRTVLDNPTANRNGLQEPGIVELKDGRLLMFMRTGLGQQYYAYSRDGGDTWTAPEPSALASPLSPASIKRIPKTGHLLAVWNDHSGVAEELKTRGLRTPLTLAVSRDEGRTWEHARNLEGDPSGWYCYTAIAFAEKRVLLGYVAGGAGRSHLSRSVVKSVDLDWIYGRR